MLDGFDGNNDALDNPIPGHLLTVEEVARRLNVSALYVKNLVRSGTLPHIALGHKTKRIDPQAVDDLIRSKAMLYQPPHKPPSKPSIEAAHRALRQRRAQRNGTVNVINSLDQAEALSPVPAGFSEDEDELEL
jgi:excisionase family DNA binding protein